MQTSVDSAKLEMKNVHILKNANHVRALPHSTILYLVNLDTLYPPRDAIRLHWVLIHFLDLPNQKLDAGSFFLSRSAADRGSGWARFC